MTCRVAEAGDDRIAQIFVAIQYALRQAPLRRHAQLQR